MSSHITVYGTAWCSDCRRAKRFPGEQQVLYRWVNVEEDPPGLAVVEKANDGKHIVPTIVFEDGTTLVEPSNTQLAPAAGLRDAPRRGGAGRGRLALGSYQRPRWMTSDPGRRGSACGEPEGRSSAAG